jgi:hypothetical protein
MSSQQGGKSVCCHLGAVSERERDVGPPQKLITGDTMVKKIVLALIIGIMALPLVPSEGMCWYGRPGYGYYHGYHHNDALLWGLSGLVVGAAVTTAVLQPPPQRVVYAVPPPAVYTYPPSVPPGMCRWERYVLDGYGRTLLDHYGQPVKEYTIGPCQNAPY